MQRLRRKVLGGIFTFGGSISRLREDVYREAADLAYYFHWQRGDIMGMNLRERREWLLQIKRIHMELKQARDTELKEQASIAASIRQQEEG